MGAPACTTVTSGTNVLPICSTAAGFGREATGALGTAQAMASSRGAPDASFTRTAIVAAWPGRAPASQAAKSARRIIGGEHSIRLATSNARLGAYRRSLD